MAAGALALGLAGFFIVLVAGAILKLPGGPVMIGAGLAGALVAAVVLLLAKTR